MPAQQALWLPNLTEADFKDLGLTHSEVIPEYPLDSIKGRIQIRDIKHVAPPTRVNEYAQRMKVEQTPPGLITQDGYIVDSNTRVAAAHKIKRAHLPVVMVEVDYEGANQRTKAKLEALAAKANRHGETLDKGEKMKAVRELVADGWTSEMISRFVGVTAAVVTKMRDEVTAQEKFDKLGMASNGNLQGASLRALGKVADLNDEPFKALSTLAADAGLNSPEIKELATKVREAGADSLALALLDEERKQRTPQIEERRLTGSGKPPVPRMLRQHLGFVTKYSGNEGQLVERGSSYIETHIETLEKAITVLQSALARQKAEL